MSKIEIINRALLKLGEPPVSSLNDAAFGKSYEMIFDDVKNLLLSSYPWRFAAVKKRLARIDKKYGRCFMYPIPADCMLVLKVAIGDGKNDNIGYEIADGCIVTEFDRGIEVEYVKRSDGDDVFPPLFREAMAAKVAAELAMRLKHSVNIKEVFDNEFYNLIRQAELNNEIMKSAELLGDNSWVSVRENWSF